MRKLLIALLGFCCWPPCTDSPAAAQQLPSRDVYVSNPMPETSIKFTIICDSGQHKQQTKHELKPLTGELYKCSDGKSSMQLKVASPHKKSVLVKLEPKKRYEFYWDADKSQWQVREIAPRT